MPTNPKKPAIWPRYARAALQQTLALLSGISDRISAEEGLDAKAKAIEAKAKEIQYAAQRGETIKVLSLTAELRNINADFRAELLELDRLAADAREILRNAQAGDYTYTAGNQ